MDVRGAGATMAKAAPHEFGAWQRLSEPARRQG